MRNKRASKNKNKIGGATATLNFLNKNVYVGDVKEEEGSQIPHGRGKMTFANGATYEGDYVNGRGEIRFDSGLIYDGQTQDNQRHGEGKMKYSNGRIFTCKWNKGKILIQNKWYKNK